MPKVRCRNSIVPAALLMACLGARPAAAQTGPYGDHGPAYTRAVTGAYVDIATRNKAERRLGHLHARLHRDEERGDAAAVERDAQRIHDARYRVQVNEWLIRKNMCDQHGPYPNPYRLDPITCGVIAQYGVTNLLP